MFGFIFLGINFATVFVPLLPDVIDAIEEKEGKRDYAMINDKASVAFNIACSLGTIIGPILGGVLSDQFGFIGTCDIFASAGFIFGVVYFAVAILPRLMVKKA
jgi:MFS family permease